MTAKWIWWLGRLRGVLALRAALFLLVAVASVVLADRLGPWVPESFEGWVEASAIADILKILASSTLAVAIFSLNITVSALAQASSSVTPRAARLLHDDQTAQNVVSTLIGVFLFSLLGLIALNTGWYSERGMVVLFVVTLGVIALMMLTLLGWIQHVRTMGRLGDSLERVESATRTALLERRDTPYGGGQALVDPLRQIPEAATAVLPLATGYVEHVDYAALAEWAACHEARVWVTAQAGHFVHPRRPLARLCFDSDPPAEETVETLFSGVRAAFSIGVRRDFRQDPRFGFCVLAEVASRALSPAVNDPGTAIDVLGRAQRLLEQWVEPRREPALQARDLEAQATDADTRLWVPPVHTTDLCADVFLPIIRDGAVLSEVQQRLVHTLEALLALDPIDFGAAVRLCLEAQRVHVCEKMVDDAQRQALLVDNARLLEGLADEFSRAADRF